MPAVLRCPQGHEWEPTGCPPETIAVCPICGAVDRTVTAHAFSTRIPNPAETLPEELPTLEGYELLAELGRGGMGIVYKAKHLERDRVVALKVIRKDRLGNAGILARFWREALASARVSHPAIVQVHAYDQQGETHFLVMEYVPGLNLQTLIEERGALAVPLACDYLRQAALGLQHAFERGLVHRDIKPSNLMLTGPASAPHQVLKILDMGVARLLQVKHTPDALTTLTHDGAVLGTPDFIAPEQLENPHDVDIRADLYSLGCTAYFILSGKVPFPGGTLFQKLDRQRWENPPSVEQLNPRVPAPLAAVVHRLMAKQPAERFQTPGELAEILDRISDGSSQVKVESLPVAARLVGHRGGVAALAFVPGTSLLLSGGRDKSLRFWDVAEGREVRRLDFPQEIGSLAVSPDGKRVLLAVGVGLRLLDVEDGRELLRCTGHLDAIRAVAFAEDGMSFVSGGDKTVRLWDASTGKTIQRFVGHHDAVTSVAVAGAEKLVLSGSRGRTMRLWNAQNGQEVRNFAVPQGAVLSVAFSPDREQIVSAHFDRTVRVWDRASGQERRLLQGHKQMASCLAFAPDGTRLLSGSHDRSVRVWDLESGAELYQNEGHTAEVNCVAWSSGAASGDAAGTIVLWKAPPDEQGATAPVTARSQGLNEVTGG